MSLDKKKQKDLNEEYEEYKEKKEDLIRIEIDKGNKIREETTRIKREIEYKDEQSRLTYYYHQKLREQTASVYAKYRKAEIIESLIKEGVSLLQSKIDEEENKYQNIDSMVNTVQTKVANLLQKEHEFYKVHKNDMTVISRSDSDSD